MSKKNNLRQVWLDEDTHRALKAGAAKADMKLHEFAREKVKPQNILDEDIPMPGDGHRYNAGKKKRPFYPPL